MILHQLICRGATNFGTRCSLQCLYNQVNKGLKLAATSKIVKHFWSRVLTYLKSTAAGKGPLAFA